MMADFGSFDSFDSMFGSSSSLGTMDSMTSIGTQKTMHMIFIVDNSGSMSDKNRMNAVNAAFRNMIPELQKIQNSVQGSFKILISIMLFNEDPEWLVEPTEINYYVHNDIIASEYVTYFSRAFEELNSKLSSKAFFSDSGKKAQPYIMLMTDGAPTPGDDYEPVIQKLNQNGWFKAAQKYAVLIGEDTVNDPAARAAVMSFAGGHEGIVDAADAKTIAEQVSAKTLIVVDHMTHHRDPVGGEIRKNSRSNNAGTAQDAGSGIQNDTQMPDFDFSSGMSDAFPDPSGGTPADTPDDFGDNMPNFDDLFGSDLIF